MRIYKTQGDTGPALTRHEQEQIYNGLDSCLTLEVFHAIAPKLDATTSKVYDHARALQAPIFEMECRGVLVDLSARSRVLAQLYNQKRTVDASLREIVKEGMGLHIEWKKLPSPKQLSMIFYDLMGLRKQYKRGKNGTSVTTDRKALEALRAQSLWATPVINHILSMRDLQKKISVLETGIDRDGRIRTTFNIAGTDTGRLASYESASGSGTNLQNVTNELRLVFVADKGKKLAYIDLSQAESRAVGAIEWNLFHDGTYLDACESGDLHTAVTRMCWDYFDWRDDDPAHNKDIAEQSFYRHFTYRDASKRLGHATNYYGKPPHIAKEVRVPLPLVEDFQRKYLTAFPHREWHQWVSKRLITHRHITTFMGRRRTFFGRPFEDETLRSAIAYEPQSAVGDYMNKGLIALHRASLPSVQILLQVHDALVLQYDEHLEDTLVPKIQRILEIEIPLKHDRSLVIPTDAMTGWNWAYAHNSKKEVVNPNGLVKFKGHDKRVRVEEASLLDRRVSSVYLEHTVA